MDNIKAEEMAKTLGISTRTLRRILMPVCLLLSQSRPSREESLKIFLIPTM